MLYCALKRVSIETQFQADHNKDLYAVFLKHTTNTPFEITTEGRLKYKTKLYSITSSLHLKEQKQISVELHIDQ